MAKYVYLCESCEADFELKRPMAEADLAAACPACGTACKRRPTTFGFVKVGNRASKAATDGAPKAARPHVAGCPCCMPRRSVPAPATQDSA